jgi:pimeloyl-ACP methyl ester carboxylesterase
MVSDGIELSELLRKTLKQDKLIVLGHSWGTRIGVLMAKARPDLFYAYVGTGQLGADPATRHHRGRRPLRRLHEVGRVSRRAGEACVSFGEGPLIVYFYPRAMTEWQPYDEPLRITLARTVGIAVVAGVVLANSWGGRLRWQVASAAMLWPSFGGHWFELWFLNWLRPRLSPSRATQIAARLVVWFVAGVGLALGMWLTLIALTQVRRPLWATWWVAGFAFIGIELVAHVVLQLRGRPSFFNGRG